MRAKSLIVLATRTEDQPVIEQMTSLHGVKGPSCFTRDGSKTILAGYGRHPWFSHQLYDDSCPSPTFTWNKEVEDIEDAKGRHYKAVLTPAPEDPTFWHDLPTPEPLSEFISQTRARLQADPVAMVGEIGLDKIFRLPMQWESPELKDQDPGRTPGGRQRRPLSPHNIRMEHQKVVLLAHLRLAGELGRPVSVHGVQVNGVLYDLLTSCWRGYERKGRNKRSREKDRVAEEDEQPKPFPPRICLHSFSGQGDAVKQYLKPSIPSEIFFSFSLTHNLSTKAARDKFDSAVRMVPDDRILVESDLHSAGDVIDSALEDMYRTLCETKGWNLEQGVAIIGDNYKRFVFGSDR